MKGNILRKGITNFKYVLVSQTVSYLLSFLTSFVLPAFFSVKANGYYQVYLFYTTYVGILHFGFNDGVYLKYGGCDYDQLPADLFRSYIRFYVMLCGSEIAVFTALSMFEGDPSKRYAFAFVIGNILVVNLSALFNYINQITNRVKKYSFAVVMEKAQIVLALVILVALRRVDFRLVIATDFCAKVVVLAINLYNARGIVFGKAVPMRPALPSCVDNIRVGMKLMIANFMGMLVMGLGKFILERFGTVSDFSLYSFAVSSINLAMMFVSSMSLILYPMLCRLEKKNLPNYFMFINRLLCAVVFVMMLVYYPLVPAIRILLKKYVPVLGYLYLLFPIVIMQSKMQLLINTYYKSLREERAMMSANLSSVVMFLVICIPLFYFHPTISTIVWSTLITFTWRCYASEWYLKKKMEIRSHINMAEELAMAVAFILSAGLLGGAAGLLVYAACVAAYLVVNRKALLGDIRKVRSCLKET